IYKGVATQIKNKNSFILQHHCISHHLALAAKDATSNISEFHQYKTLVHEIYRYFSKSPEQILQLKMIEEQTGDPQLTVLNIINTHWLFLLNVVNNLHQILNSIIDVLLSNSIHSIIAATLYKKINDDFVIKTKFLADILEILHITIQAIDIVFIRSNNNKPTWGIYLYNYMNDNYITSDQLPSFINLPVENQKLFNEYGLNQITILSNFYGTDKPGLDNNFQAIIIANEL
ncbi:19005_t:CDS:2, partial [Racocetra persica]